MRPYEKQVKRIPLYLMARQTAKCSTHVAKVLAPALTPGDIVVMDNLNVHQSETAKKLIEDREVAVRTSSPIIPI